MEKDSTILVTGGAGFIGSNLCDHLLSQGHRVVCLDNFITGKPENIQHQFNNPNFKLIVGDIRNLEDCRKATEGVDYVLHEAALGSVPRSIKYPITTIEVNICVFLKMHRTSLFQCVRTTPGPQWGIRCCHPSFCKEAYTI